jgi:hypothetical protein
LQAAELGLSNAAVPDADTDPDNLIGETARRLHREPQQGAPVLGTEYHFFTKDGTGQVRIAGKIKPMAAKKVEAAVAGLCGRPGFSEVDIHRARRPEGPHEVVGRTTIGAHPWSSGTSTFPCANSEAP